MPNGTAAKIIQISYAIPALITFAACFMWAALIPQGEESAHIAEDRTLNNLRKGHEAIEEFTRVWQGVPASIAELRAFAFAQHRNFSAFDAFGNRLEYVRLSDHHYLLRSFGSDDRQTSVFSDADPYISNWPTLPPSTPRYRYLPGPRVSIFPSAVILGLHSPNQNWYAQIFTDRYGGSRRLIVRSPEKERFLVASHDFVEEFLWMPNSYHIAFTATSSAKYRDGIYLWNILTDETINLLDYINQSSRLLPDTPQQRYFLSLAGVSAIGDELLAYIAPANTPFLNPFDFLNREQLFRIKLPSPGVGVQFSQMIDSKLDSPLAEAVNINQDIIGEKQNDKVYQKWLSLKLEGNLEHVISEWQKFAENNTSSPILPYCLWILASIYHDAYQLVKPVNKQDAAVLRALGAEFADGLAQFAASPSYLRAFGSYIYEHLAAEKALPYQVSSLEMPEVANENN